MMDKSIDLTGQRFGRWLVITRGDDYLYRGNKARRWKCRCDCGKEKEVHEKTLLNGTSKSCGCLSKEITRNRARDLTGKRFGSLVAIKRTDDLIQPSGQHKQMWLCKCKCGETTRVMATNLRRGLTKSCGCEQTKATLYKGTRVSMLGKNMKTAKNNKSGCKGVCWDKQQGKWSSYIYLSKTRHRLGWYENLDDAIQARKIAEEELFQPIIEEYDRIKGGV